MCPRTLITALAPIEAGFFRRELAESDDYHTAWYFTLGRAKRVVETAIDAMQDIYKSRFVVYDVEETELE